MKDFHLSNMSKKRLSGVDPDLVKVVERAIELTAVDFVVLEGLRSKARQEQLLAMGSTRTMESRHLTGHAVDVAPLMEGKVPWTDLDQFELVAAAMFQAADELGVLIQWGGDWDSDGVRVDKDKDETFMDGPHFQIPHPWRVETCQKAQERRQMARRLSPDITPGLSPEDMRDEDFEPVPETERS